MYKLFLILSMFLSQLYALETVSVNEKIQEVNLSPKSDIFFDSQSIYSYYDVSSDMFSGNFVPIKSKSVSAGYTSDTIWTRFSIKNEDDEIFVGDIEIPIPWINKLDVYIKNDSKLSVKNLGASLPFDKREISSSSFFIPITINPQDTATVYIKAQGTNAITLAPHLYSHKKSSKRLTYIAMFNASLIGMILIMFLYNMYMYLVLKDDNYLYYSMYLLGLVLFMGAYYGYNFQLFWKNSPSYNEAISLPIVLFSFFTGLLFTRNFLDTKKNFVKTDQFLSILMYHFVLLGLLSFIIGNSLITLYATIFLILLYSAGVIYVSILSIQKNISGSKHFLAAWIMSSISLFLSSAMVQGFIDYDNLLYDSFAIGIILNVLLLAFALVVRSKYTIEKSSLELKENYNIVDKISKSKDELQHIREKLERKVDRQSIQLKEKDKKLKKFSIKDELTSLYNREKLEELLTTELHRSKRYLEEFSIIIVNIDGLGNINEKHSQQVGDSVIKEVSEVLIKSIRYIDTVGRWSDTEYLIICPETNSQQASVAATHIKKAIQNYKFFFIGSVTVSFGVTSSLGGDSGKEIIQRAYKALSLAQENGGNRVEED